MTTSKVKKDICEKLIEKGLVREFDIVMHSRIEGKTLEMIVSDENNICPSLTTRPGIRGSCK